MPIALHPTTRYTSKTDTLALEGLLAGVAAGNLDALAKLYHQTKAAVYGLALSYLKNVHDAQEITQDVFVHIWSRAGQYTPGGTPMGWLLAVCRNLCLMRLRSEQPHTALSDEEWNAIPSRDTGLDPEERLLLQNALAVLSEEERRIVLLHSASGLKHREIGILLKKPLSTVLSKHRRALKKMRVYLEGDSTP